MSQANLQKYKKISFASKTAHAESGSKFSNAESKVGIAGDFQ